MFPERQDQSGYPVCLEILCRVSRNNKDQYGKDIERTFFVTTSAQKK